MAGSNSTNYPVFTSCAVSAGRVMLARKPMQSEEDLVVIGCIDTESARRLASELCKSAGIAEPAPPDHHQNGTLKMADQESTAVTIPADCAPHIKDACGELEQLIRLLGTMKIDSESDMAVRGIAVRMSQLHCLVFGAIIGGVDPVEALATLRGPGQWFAQA